ncbi:MAG: acetate--CoA ligase [Thermoplasmata archaeon]
MKGVVWKPSKRFIEATRIWKFMKKHRIKDYRRLIERSARDPDWFWPAIIEDLNIEFYKKYRKLRDASKGVPWTEWFVGGKINIVHNCLDRHASSSKKHKAAVVWEGEGGETRTVTFSQLSSEVNRLASAMREAGVGRGDTVGIYMPMCPEIVAAMYAAMKLGAIVIPIFSGYAAPAVALRLNHAEAKLLFTADGSYRRGKHVPIKAEADRAAAQVPSLRKVVVFKRTGADVPWTEGRDVWWQDFVRGKPADCPTEQMDSMDPALIIYTSGTTGMPKGTVHSHAGALVQVAKEVAYFFDIRDEDLFFWLTDIGWMMGPWMIMGNHNLAGTVFIYEGAPDYPAPDRLWDMVERHRISILGISPTAIRMLMRSGEEWVRKHDLSSLRILGSTGEPWDPPSWLWYFNNVGGGRCPIINISGGTDIIGCFLAPLPICPLKPTTLVGPGIGMDIDCVDEDCRPVRGRMGYLVAKSHAPSMTRGLWKDPEKYIETYWSRWPNVWDHGDWVLVDEDGYWFILGRADDVIKVAGRRIGPSEVETALMKHPAVSEAAAIGVPHEIKGEGIVCFAVLRPGFSPSETLKEELKDAVARELGKVDRPEDVVFVSALPKTRTAKIVRRVIKARFLGKELGDVSSIENPQAIEEIPRMG